MNSVVPLFLPVGGDVDEVLDDAAHPEAEGPPNGVVHGRRRDADRHEEQVRQGQVLKMCSGFGSTRSSSLPRPNKALGIGCIISHFRLGTLARYPQRRCQDAPNR